MESDLTQRKVFGLGLSKTATTSLGKALDLLGIPTIHYPTDGATYEELTSGQYRLSILEKYQGIVDITVAPFFAQLDREYPGSKFILTTRDLDSWLDSVEAHWRDLRQWFDRDSGFKRFTEFISACVYGTWMFNRDRFRYVYETHTRNVVHYFRDRGDDLLVVDLCGGGDWERLCPFLGVPIPDAPFPHSNRKQDREDRVRRCDLANRELAAAVPSGEGLILVDDDKLGGALTGGRTVVPFLERDGLYWGRPADSTAALAELQRLHQRGLRYMAFAWPSFWWLEYYSDFAEHLRSKGRCVVDNDRLVLFDLGESSA